MASALLLSIIVIRKLSLVASLKGFGYLLEDCRVTGTRLSPRLILLVSIMLFSHLINMSRCIKTCLYTNLPH